MLAPCAYPALVLNADYRPLSFFPLSTISWRDAVSAVMEDRVDVVEEYDRSARSPSRSIRLPSVLALREFQSLDRPAPCNRINVFLRDACPEGFRCLYCGRIFPREQLTFDHVVPRCQGGRSTFGNLASACQGCNGLKGDRPLAACGMRLLAPLWHPTLEELNRHGRWFARRVLRDRWYWTVELDP